MKKAKQFKVNDKVFAKVKGYPAWPANITAVNAKKYTVEFYGTGEIGSIKAEDLFYYLKHKHNLVKPSKRKDYNDALGQIEDAVNKDGTDGNDYPDDSLTDVSVSSSTPGEKKGPKRKRSSSEKSDVSQPAKKGRDKINMDTSVELSGNEDRLEALKDKDHSVKEKDDTTKEKDDTLKEKDDTLEDKDDTLKDDGVSITESIEKNEVDTVEPKEKDQTVVDKDVTADSKDENAKNQLEVEEIEKDSDKKDPSTEKLKAANPDKHPKLIGSYTIESDTDDCVPSRTYSMVTKLISEFELQGFVEYAKHVKEHEATYKASSEEYRDSYPNHVFAVKLPSDAFVALKLHTKWPVSYKNEYERALYDGEVAERLLKMKKQLESGSLKVEDQPDSFLSNFMMSGKDIDLALQTDLLKRKKAKTELLKVEALFVELDSKIKACLGLDKADTKQAMEHLDQLKKVQLTGIMFIKHPHVLELVRRLRRYVGNVDEWKLAGKPLEKFNKDAEKIRSKAEVIWERIKRLIKVPAGASSFWAGFNDVVANFRTHTRNLTEDQICYIHSMPFTRKFFMDLYDETRNEGVTDIMQKEVSDVPVIDAL